MEQSSRQKKRPEIRQPGAGDLRQKGEGQIETIDFMLAPFFRAAKKPGRWSITHPETRLKF